VHFSFAYKQWIEFDNQMMVTKSMTILSVSNSSTGWSRMGDNSSTDLMKMEENS